MTTRQYFKQYEKKIKAEYKAKAKEIMSDETKLKEFFLATGVHNADGSLKKHLSR